MRNCYFSEDPGFLSIDLADGTQRLSKDLHEHPSFDRATFKNDLAIITMEEPVEFNGSVKRVCLPREGSFINCYIIYKILLYFILKILLLWFYAFSHITLNIFEKWFNMSCYF